MKTAALFAAALLAIPAGAAAPATPRSIPDGTYRCHTGEGQFTLALGEAVIAGHRYTVTGPQGHRTGGTWTAVPLGYRWSGDFGAVKHATLADSEPDPAGGGFVVHYALGHTSPVAITCRRG